MNEFQIGENTYRASKLPLMTQLHVSRRLAPVIAALAATAQNVKAEPSDGDVSEAAGGDTPQTAQVSFMDLIQPMAEAMASLSDGDTEYIISNTLEVVQRKIHGDAGWAPVWSKQGRAPMFQDLTMIDVLMISARVIMQQIGPFGSVPSFGLNLPR